MSNTATTATVYLKDYTVPAFLIPEVELDISLFEDDALVRSKLVIARNRGAARSTAPLVLDIDELIVESIILDGLALKTSQYTLDDRYLTLSKVPDRAGDRLPHLPQEKHETDGDICFEHGFLQSL